VETNPDSNDEKIELARESKDILLVLERCLSLEIDEAISDTLWILSNLFSKEEEDNYAETILMAQPTLLLKIVSNTENSKSSTV